MQTYPNQNIVVTHRLYIEDGKTFASMDQASLQAAMRGLKKVGSVKLWLYLTKNKQDFQLALSQKACEEWGITISEYRSGKHELKEKGYLVQRDNSNMMDFYEYPWFQNPEIVQERINKTHQLVSDLANHLNPGW